MADHAKEAGVFSRTCMTLALLAVGTADQSIPLAGVGSPLGYITRELGVTEAEIDELRDKFLE